MGVGRGRENWRGGKEGNLNRQDKDNLRRLMFYSDGTYHLRRASVFRAFRFCFHWILHRYLAGD